jgi:hypothetical protein
VRSGSVGMYAESLGGAPSDTISSSDVIEQRGGLKKRKTSMTGAPRDHGYQETPVPLGIATEEHLKDLLAEVRRARHRRLAVGWTRSTGHRRYWHRARLPAVAEGDQGSGGELLVLRRANRTRTCARLLVSQNLRELTIAQPYRLAHWA